MGAGGRPARDAPERRPQVHAARREAARLVGAGAHEAPAGARRQGRVAAHQAPGRPGRRQRRAADAPRATRVGGERPLARGDRRRRPGERLAQRPAGREQTGVRPGEDFATRCRRHSGRRARSAAALRPAGAGHPGQGGALRRGEWLHEIKFDGYRAISTDREGRRSACTPATARTGPTSIGPSPPSWPACPWRAPCSTERWSYVLPDGRTSFQELQDALGDARGEGESRERRPARSTTSSISVPGRLRSDRRGHRGPPGPAAAPAGPGGPGRPPAPLRTHRGQRSGRARAGLRGWGWKAS